MKVKQLVVMAVVAVLLVFGAWKTSQRDTQAPPDEIGALLLPDLPVNDITRLVIAQGADTVTVERVEASWTIAEKYGYAADFKHLRDTLIACKDIKVMDVLDATDTLRDELGLSAAQAKRVTFYDASGAAVATLLIGDYHMRKAPQEGGFGREYPDGVYVTKAGGDSIYLVGNELDRLATRPLNWLDTDLLDVNGTSLTSITISQTNAPPVELKQAEGMNELQVVGITEDEEVDTGNLATVKNTLSYLRAQDIADPTLSDTAMGFDTAWSFVATTQDGVRYTLHIGGPAGGDARYVRIGVDATAPKPDVAEEGEAPPPPPEVDTLNAKFSGWTYVIASYKTDGMIMDRSSLVKPKPEPQPKADESASIEEDGAE